MPTTTARRLPAPDLAVVAAGGMAGATMRYALSRAVDPSGPFPWATFLTNVSGCFVLGIVLAWTHHRPAIDPRVRLFVATGVIGAYTTMSTYAVETCLLVRDSHTPTALLYASASVVVGLLAAWLGTRAAPR